MRLRIDDDTTLDLTDQGDGTPIVLLHPFPFSKDIWDDVAAMLSPSLRILRFDLRGCGQSSSPAGPYLMETLAGDLADVLDARDITQAVIVGNSIGAMVALSFYRMFAERVLGMALVCGRTNADSLSVAQERRNLAEAIEQKGTQPLVDAYRERIFSPSTYRESPTLVAQACARMEHINPRGAAALLRGMALRLDANDLLSDMEMPVRVIAGRQDSLLPTEELREIARNIRGARFDLLECGHLPPLEAPQALASILLDLAANAAAFARRA